MNIGNYLKKNFPGVNSVKKVAVNGKVKGYYARSSNGNEIYIPVSALKSNNVAMLSYIPGSGGSGNDAASLRSRIKNNPPNYIVTISAGAGDRNYCTQTGYNMAKGLNMKVRRSVTVCYSLSGYIGIDHTADFLKKHPEIQSAVISCEPYPYGIHSVYQGDSAKIAAMKKSGTKLIFVTPQSFHINMKDEINSLNRRGLDAYWLQTHYTTDDNHYAVNWDVLNSGMIEYIFGDRDNFNKNPNSNYKTGYRLVGYDKKTGKLVYVDYDQLREAGMDVVAIPDPKAITAGDKSKAKTKVSPAEKKYASLKEIEDRQITSKDGSPVSSEYTYVADTMNNLKHLVKNTSFINGLQNIKCKDPDGIPGCIMGYVNQFFDIVGCLINDLALEADAITSYGQALVDMDFDMKGGAETLGQIIEEDNSSKYISIGGLEAFEEPDEDEEEEEENFDNPEEEEEPDEYDGDPYYSSPGDSGYSSSPGATTTTETPTATEPEEDSDDENFDDIDQDVEEVELNEDEIPPIVITEEPTPTEPTTKPEETPTTEVTTKPEETPTTVVTPTVNEQPVQQAPVNNTHYTETYTEYPPRNEAPTVPVEEVSTEPVVTEEPTELVSETPNIEEIIPKSVPTYTKVPAATEPVPTSKKKGTNILPVVGGIAVAAAAGIGAKAYIDKKTNANNGEEDTMNDNQEFSLDDDDDYDDTLPPEKEKVDNYVARNLEDIEGLQ